MPSKGQIGLVILALVALAALLAPWIAPFDPNDQDIFSGLAPPLTLSAEGGVHVLGTDRLGQDVLSRIIFGSRVSLIVAIGAVGASAALGIPFGLAGGFLGRIPESAMLVASDIVLSIPFVLLALVL